MRRHPWWHITLMASFLAWDYSMHPNLALFVIYVRGEGQEYDWTQPRFPILSMDTLVTEIDCLALPFLEAGPWYAVMKAMDREGTPYKASNEIKFWWSATNGCRETPISPSSPSSPAPRLPPDVSSVGRLPPPNVLTRPTWTPLPKPKPCGDLVSDSWRTPCAR